MGIYSILDRHILLSLAEMVMKRNLTGAYKQACKEEWLSKEQIEELQNKRLKALVEHCYLKVPYYTHLFDQMGLKPEDISTYKDLEKLPVLTKEIIRDNFEALKSTDIASRLCSSSNTGGSTGTPMKFYEDMQTWNSLRGMTRLMWHQAGYELGEKMYTLAGSSLVGVESRKKKLTPKEIYDTWIMRNQKYDSTDITPEAMARHYKRIMQYKPRALRGYATSMYYLARFIEQNGLEAPKVVAVFTTGEKLHSKHRYKIQQVFRVPVFDGYGASDGGVCALECPMHEGLHISEINCMVEITDMQGHQLPDGETGHVLTTDLNNYAFPFLRYKVGDMAYIKPSLCSCGRGSRLLGEVIGREGRAIFTKQGRPYSTIILDNMMFPDLDYNKDENWAIYHRIERFQIRQDKEGDLEILIKPTSPHEKPETFSYVVDNFRQYFPESKVQLRFVDSIPTLPSGKDDYCVSEYRPQND